LQYSLTKRHWKYDDWPYKYIFFLFRTRDEVSKPVTVWFFYHRHYFPLYQKFKLLCIFHDIGASKPIPHNLTTACHITGVYCSISVKQTNRSSYIPFVYYRSNSYSALMIINRDHNKTITCFQDNLYIKIINLPQWEK
jgi:hypothetical protein